jgi:acetyl esterase
MERMLRTLAAVAGLALAITLARASPAPAQSVETGVRYVEADGVALMMDVYRPPAGRNNGIGVVVIHGGRWMQGDRGETPADLIAAQGFVAFSVDYRLAPEHTYPAAIEDLQTAVRYIRDHAEEYGIDPAKIWAIGGSAGGHLAALLGTLGQGPTTQDARIAVVVSWSGPMDLELLARSNAGLEQAATQFVGCRTVDDPACAKALREASPVMHLDPSDAPIFIANGTAEPIPFDQAVVGARAADEAGVDQVLWTVEGNVHGFSYVREVLPPAVAFVMNEIEGQENPVSPPAVPSVDIPTPTSPTGSPRATSGARGEGYTPPRRDRGSSLPLVVGILALVAAAVLGTVLLVRGRPGTGAR